MQSNRTSGAGRATSYCRVTARRRGLFSTTALIPAFAAVAGGSMLLAPQLAQAQNLARASVESNASAVAELCADPDIAACPPAGETDSPPQTSPVPDAGLRTPRLSLLNDGLAPQFSIVGNSVIYTDGDVVDVEIGITNPAVTGHFSIASGSATQRGRVFGQGSFEKIGAGTLILAANNTFEGTTTISAGTLQIGNGGTSGTLGGGNVTNNAALVFDRSNDFSVSNAISGSGSLTKRGAGTMTATGALSHSGSTNILGGTLAIASTGSFNSSGNVTIGGGNLTLNNAVSTVREVTQNTGNLTLNSGARLDIALNSYNLVAGNILGNGTIRLLNNGRTLTISGAATSIASGITIEGADPVSNTVSIGNLGQFYTLGARITGSAMRLTVNNTSITVIDGDNSFGGGTSLNAGSLVVGSDTALGTGALTMGGFTILTPGSSAFDGTRTVGNPIVLGGTGVALSVLNSAAVMRLTGVISGEPGFTKTGAGTVILSGANTYFGGTNVVAGTLALGQVAAGAIGAAGTGPITLGNDSTLQSNVTGTLGNALTIGGGISATIGATSGNTLTIAGSVNIGGGTGTTLTIGSSTLNGTVLVNPFFGSSFTAGSAIAVAGGTLRQGSVAFIGSFTGGATIGTGTTTATLDMNGFNTLVQRLSGTAAGVITQ